MLKLFAKAFILMICDFMENKSLTPLESTLIASSYFVFIEGDYSDIGLILFLVSLPVICFLHGFFSELAKDLRKLTESNNDHS